MLVIGARFRTLAAARAALRAVRASVPVSSGDVAIRPLGSTRYDAPEESFLLAGRFEPADADAVIAIVHGEGGRVIERRSELPRRDSVAAGTGHATSRESSRSSSRPPSRSANASSSVAAGIRGHVRAQNWLRRPSPPLRVRAARGHRLEG